MSRDTNKPGGTSPGATPSASQPTVMPPGTDAVGETVPAPDSTGPGRGSKPPSSGSSGRLKTAAELPLADAERYTIEAEFARGGLGRILRAADRRLGRVVAIKELRRGGADARARFLREAMITARLQHPAIVPVYDAARWTDGAPFYAMKLVHGRTLEDLIDQGKTLVARMALVPNVIAMAEAMAFAHSERIIHRDLKPTNVLVGSFGETVVIDWGLAKDLREDGMPEVVPTGEVYADEGQTVAGAVMGTPAYMPPEQARGEPVDERADVYAIGAILYHVLAGEPSYVGKSSSEVVAMVAARPPRPLHDVQPTLPSDLVAIIEKAMARRADDRYPTARELAEDLERFQTGQLVSSHVYSPAALFKRWLRRNRAAVAVGASLLVALAVSGVISVRRIARERGVAQAARIVAEQQRESAVARGREAQVARDQAEQRAAALTLQQAEGALARDPTAALAWLKQYPASGSDWQALRGIAADALGRGVARHVFVDHVGGVTVLAWAGDGKTLVSSGQDGTIRVWDVTTGTRTVLSGHDGSVHDVAIARGGLIVSAGSDRTVRVWEGGVSRVLDAAASTPGVIELAPDGETVAWAADSGEVRAASLRAGGGAAVRVVARHADRVAVLAWSADGRWLASAARDGTVRITEVAGRGTASTELRAEPEAALAFSPDSKLLAIAGDNGALRLAPVAGGAVRTLAVKVGQRAIVRFASDGRSLAVTGADGMAHIVDMASGAARPLGPLGIEVMALALSPDDRRLATGDQDESVRVWSLATGESWRLRGHQGPVAELAWSPDGRLLATTSWEGTIRVWDVDALPVHRVLRGHSTPISRAAWSPDGKSIASAGWDGAVRLWDKASGASRILPQPHDGRLTRLLFSADGRKLISAGFDGTLHRWDLATFAVQVLRGHTDLITTVVFSPDDRTLASASVDETIRLWDAAGASRVLRGHADGVWSVAFAPDGKVLASAGDDTTVRLWDLTVAEPLALHVLTGHTDSITRVAYSPDGKLLGSSSLDGTIRLWDVAAGTSRVLRGHGGSIGVFGWSPDGTMVASCASDRTCRLWDVASGDSRVLHGNEASVLQGTFSPDGTRLATAGADGTVRFWDVTSREGRILRGHDGEVYSVQFSPDGHELLSAGADGTVRIWRADDAPDVPAAEPTAQRAWLDAMTSAVLDATNLPATP